MGESVIGFVRRGSYADSIELMQMGETLRRLPGIAAAAVLMGTPANVASLQADDLLPSEATGAGPNDLVVAIRADSDHAGRDAVAQAERLLSRRTGSGPALAADVGPRSIASAARRTAGANVALISVPGDQAVSEAHQALAAGLHVCLWSDGVSLADERALKERARASGLLMMGAECGTSILHGVGLGFSNRVRRGSIGVVGASGTGIQEVTTLIHRLGGGISHAIGTGGRDLSEEIGGITTRQGLALLAEDSGTRVIVLVSKPGSAAVGGQILKVAAAVGKPVIACLLGWQGDPEPTVRSAQSLEEAAVAAVEAAGLASSALDTPGLGDRRPPLGPVLGLFTGGTLCDEARRIVGDVALRFVDFGDGRYTRGRPHPMIDPALRSEAVARAGAESAGVLLVDVVLGDCAHPDPAGAVGLAIDAARAAAARPGRQLEVVAHVVGTDDDPQRLGEQEAALRARAVVVCATNRHAALVARRLARGD